MPDFSAAIRRRRAIDAAFSVAGAILTIVVLAVLGALVFDLVRTGLSRLDLSFLTSFPSRRPEKAGVLSAWVGTLCVIFVTASTAIPLGIAAGVYLEEYARKSWLTAVIEVNIGNLAGVPSIVYGLMALGLFVYRFGFGQSILSGGLTLALLILPIVIVATREALRAIPQHIREAAYALGATRWQVVRHHLLPYSAGGIATGVIIALSRALGETAPLITIGALTFIAFLPRAPFSPVAPEDGGGFVGPFDWLGDSFTVLPIQMFNWVSRPGDSFLPNAAATGLVLMIVTLAMNAGAIVIRSRARRRIRW